MDEAGPSTAAPTDLGEKVTDFLRKMFRTESLDEGVCEKLDGMLGVSVDYICERVEAEVSKPSAGDHGPARSTSTESPDRSGHTGNEGGSTSEEEIESMPESLPTATATNDAIKTPAPAVDDGDPDPSTTSSPVPSKPTAPPAGAVCEKEVRASVDTALGLLTSEKVIEYDREQGRISLRIAATRNTVLIHDVPLSVNKGTIEGLFKSDSQSSSKRDPAVSVSVGAVDQTSKTRVWYAKFESNDDAVNAALKARAAKAPWDPAKKVQCAMKSNHLVQSFYPAQPVYFSPLFSTQPNGPDEEAISSLTPLTLASLGGVGETMASLPSKQERAPGGDDDKDDGKLPKIQQLRDSVRENLPATLPSLGGDAGNAADPLFRYKSVTRDRHAEGTADAIMGRVRSSSTSSLPPTAGHIKSALLGGSANKHRLQSRSENVTPSGFTNLSEFLPQTAGQTTSSNADQSVSDNAMNLSEGVLQNPYVVMPIQPEYCDGGFRMPDGQWIPAQNAAQGTWCAPGDETMMDPNFLMKYSTRETPMGGFGEQGGGTVWGATPEPMGTGTEDPGQGAAFDEACMMYDPSTGLIYYTPDQGETWYPQQNVGLDESGNFFLDPSSATSGAALHGSVGMMPTFFPDGEQASGSGKGSAKNSPEYGPQGASSKKGASGSGKRGGKSNTGKGTWKVDAEVNTVTVANSQSGYTHEYRRYAKEELLGIISEMCDGDLDPLPGEEASPPGSRAENGSPSKRDATSPPPKRAPRAISSRIVRPEALDNPKFADVVRSEPNLWFFRGEEPGQTRSSRSYAGPRSRQRGRKGGKGSFDTDEGPFLGGKKGGDGKGPSRKKGSAGKKGAGKSGKKGAEEHTIGGATEKEEQPGADGTSSKPKKRNKHKPGSKVEEAAATGDGGDAKPGGSKGKGKGSGSKGGKRGKDRGPKGGKGALADDSPRGEKQKPGGKSPERAVAAEG